MFTKSRGVGRGVRCCGDLGCSKWHFASIKLKQTSEVDKNSLRSFRAEVTHLKEEGGQHERTYITNMK